MKDAFKTTLAIIAFIALIAVSVWWNFHVWRIVHPQAPTWTFFAGG